MGTGYKNRGSGAAGLGFKNRGAKLVEGAAYTNRGATDGVNEVFKNRGQAWGSDAYYNRGPNDFASLGTVNPLNTSEFYAPLTHSLILTRGTGDPTYSRATNSWEFDNEGKLILVPSGAARFGGARMVRNLLAATSTLSTQNVTTVATSYTLSFYGTGSVTLSGTATGTLNGTGASNRVQTTVTATAGTLTLTVSGSVTDAQLENVTGQADQTASEYVSVGVLSAPFHGAGVDGVKYFSTNKDGSLISDASLLGYHAEGARTNSLLYSRDLKNGLTTGKWIPAKGSELITNGDFATTDLTGWTDLSTGTGTVSAATGLAVFVGTTGLDRGVIEQSVTGLTVGKIYAVSATFSSFVSGTGYLGISATSGRVNSTPMLQTSVNIDVNVGFIATNATMYLDVWTDGNGGSFSIDNISVKEAAIQVTTCTGIDNAANSASTLTAGAANATILQTLTLASAARSSSAYVKRRTGTGTISFTRDGGTTWTDITSQINSSTWTRVKIENSSVLNPSIGFLIATSGDAIDVDVVQDEAGAFISSPIITTTAAVTRNLDLLTYAVAGNLDVTKGSVFVSLKDFTAYDGIAAYLITDNTSDNPLLYKNSANGLRIYDGTSATPDYAWSLSASMQKIGASWGGGSKVCSINGTIGTGNVFDGALGVSTIRIGSANTGGFYTNAYFCNIYIWKTALTDSELVTVTTP